MDYWNNLVGAMADDLINQALYAVYRSGFMTFHIDQEWATEHGFTYDLTTTDLRLFFPQLWLMYPDTPVEFWVLPMLPPVVIFDTGYDSIDISLQLGDFTMAMMVIPDGEDPIEAFTMALAMDVPLSVDVDTQNNTLSVVFGTPTVAVDVYNELVNFNDALIEGLVPPLISLVIPFIGELLGEFPLPGLQGFTIEVISMDIFGPLHDFMGIFGSLVYNPTLKMYVPKPIP